MTDPRVDAYIKKSGAFAQPILIRIRKAVHQASPRITETIKWNVPCYEDERGILCLTPAFTRHCAWVFWTGRKPKVVDAGTLRRMACAADLPPARTLVTMVKEAMGAKKAQGVQKAKKVQKVRKARR